MDPEIMENGESTINITLLIPQCWQSKRVHNRWLILKDSQKHKRKSQNITCVSLTVCSNTLGFITQTALLIFRVGVREDTKLLICFTPRLKD